MLSVKRFADPPKTVRPSPFWSWNERLELPELRRQIRLMKQQGYGGFFMHSRDGLRTGYLSSQWFQAVRACYDSARRLDMEGWLYDEDRWPSGAAGGLVTRGHPERAAKALLASRIRSSQLRRALAEPETLAVYEVDRVAPRRLVRARRIGTVQATKDELWRFHWVAQGPANWYNGATYIDILDPEVVERFLAVTVDGYARHVGRCFGPHMPGIFTDEPNYGSAARPGRGGGGGGIPYSLTLPEYFGQQNGIDLVSVLPDLFFESPRSAAVRYMYFRCLALRMLESFTMPYARRCRQKGLLMTGHLLAEDDLPSQISQVGFCMPHYWYMQAPGVDHLRRRHDHLLTHRQCSSAAQQAGRRRVLSELFGVSGQDMTFEDQKWIGDYHSVNGVNLFCPHLMLYSMLGDGKRDFPPTFSYHQPYWPRMRVVNDYFARIGYLLTQGEPVADVLLLHSIGSAWAVTAPPLNDLASTIGPDRSAAGRLSSQLEGILADLLGDHRDVHLGDEYLLARFGRVQNRQLVCGRMAYDLVIVPPSITWQSSTVQRLERFVAAGGKLIVVRPVPKRVDGEPAGRAWRGLLGRPNVVVVGRGELLTAVGRALARRVSVQDVGGQELPNIRHALRRDGTRDIWFFCNVSRARPYSATIRLLGAGRVERWDPLSGGCEPVSCRRVGRYTVLQHDFPPAGSLALVLDRARRQTRCRPHVTRSSCSNPTAIGSVAVPPAAPQ